MVFGDWHRAVFVGVAVALELALLVKLVVLGVNSGKQKAKEWIQKGLAFLKFFFLLASRKEDANFARESAYMHAQTCRAVIHYLTAVGFAGVLIGQVMLIWSQPFWLSIPQLWNLLIAAVLGVVCIVLPSFTRASTTDALYVAFNALSVIGLLPSHCAPEHLFKFWIVNLILVRVPSLPLARSGVPVLLANAAFMILIFLRISLQDFELVDFDGLDNLDSSLLIRLELYVAAASFAMSGMLLAVMKMKVQLTVHTGNLSSELTAASSLLRLTCDAVVELDSELRLTAHSPELSAMLLHDRAGASLDGKCITEFMQPIDAVRAIELLGTGSNESGLAKAEITAHAFHTRLVDSCSSRLCAEVFQVKYTKCDGRCYHLLGFRDFTDIKSLAGINAVDAFTEGEDSVMSSPTLSHSLSPDSPSSRAEMFEPDVQPKAFLDIDTQGMVVQAASQPLMAKAGTACTDLFPSPHMTMLLEQLRKEAELFTKRGEAPPSRVLSFEDMPVAFRPPHVDRITGNMQITQTRFGHFNVLLTFNRPPARPEAETRRRSQPLARPIKEQLSL